MANALKTNPDDLYNPDSTENYRAQARKRAIQDGDIARGIDEAEKYANDPNNSTSRNGRAADELSSLEDSALDDLSQSSSDADSTRALSSAEENPNGYYQPGQSTAGRVRSGINKAKQAGGVQGLMNKAKNLKGTVKNWRKWSPTWIWRRCNDHFLASTSHHSPKRDYGKRSERSDRADDCTIKLSAAHKN